MSYICPGCGQEFSRHSNFCVHCGIPLPKDLQPVNQICSNCGETTGQAGMIWSQSFCGNCGAELISSGPQSLPQS